MYGRRYFRGFMQIHAVWFVRKDGAIEAWQDAEVARGGDHKPDGAFADSGYMDKILKGKRNAPKIVQAIRDILEIQDCSR